MSTTQCNIEGCTGLRRSKGRNRVRGLVCEKHHRFRYPRSAEQVKNTNLRQYGLTVGDFNRMKQEQGGGCAICGEVLESPQVDHCHTTGDVRGLLCNKCNIGLGMFKDDLDLLASASSYLINSRLMKVV